MGGLDVEVSDPEIMPDAYARYEVDHDLAEFGAYFGFGELHPIELIDLEYQIAQKIHAVTDPVYIRAHDLVDLQLLCAAQPDVAKLQDLCIRTFRWRNRQHWPPIPLRDMTGWELSYSEAYEQTLIDGDSMVLPTVDQACGWFKELIDTIVKYGS